MQDDETMIFGTMPKRVGKLKVDEYDPEDVDDATAYAEGDEEDAEMMAEEDGEEYEEEPDGDEEEEAPAPKAKKARKMSEGTQRFAEMSATQLREYIVRKEYEAEVDKLLGAWKTGKRVVFSETRSPVQEPRGGQTVARSGRVVMSPKLEGMIRSHLLSEGYQLSEGARNGFLEIIQVALSEGLVDLSKRGASFDMDAPKAKRAGTGKSNEVGVELHERAVVLAQAQGKSLEQLPVTEKMQYYLMAEKGQ